MEAQFVHGSPTMVDHTPSGAAVLAGQVVVTGAGTRIAHLDIADGALGALAIEGGIYDVAKDGATAHAEGIQMYWDNTNKIAVEASLNNELLGVTVGAAGAADPTIRIRHSQPGTVGT